MKKYLNRETYSALGKEVFDRLKEIWDNDDFLVGTMLELISEDKLQKMLDFLRESGTNEVIPYSIKIDRGIL